MLISDISSFLQEALCPFISNTKHERRSLYFILQFLLEVKSMSNLPKKLGPEGVVESGSHIFYTKTLEDKTLVYLSISQPNLSMMLVWNNLADPHL